MRLVRLGLTLVLTISTATAASAQLLSSTLQQIVGCTLSLTDISRSAKLDAALQKWARDGGSGQVRVIGSAGEHIISDSADQADNTVWGNLAYPSD